MSIRYDGARWSAADMTKIREEHLLPLDIEEQIAKDYGVQRSALRTKACQAIIQFFTTSQEAQREKVVSEHLKKLEQQCKKLECENARRSAEMEKEIDALRKQYEEWLGVKELCGTLKDPRAKEALALFVQLQTFTKADIDARSIVVAYLKGAPEYDTGGAAE